MRSNNQSMGHLSPRDSEQNEKLNTKELKYVKAEIRRIKRAYIKKYGIPKSLTKIKLDGIAS